MISTIIASLHGKIPELKTLEDVLTSTIFGRLRYLPPEKILIPFLKSAQSYNPPGISLGEHLKNQGISLELYLTVLFKFWSKHPKYGEPDLILLFKGHQNGDPDLLMLIEAKLYSSKSGVGENDQLKRYYLAIHESINGFYDQDISEFKGHIAPLIYLTGFDAQAEINESTREIVEGGRVLKDPIFHLRWQQLSNILENYNNQYEPSLICNDLIDYLKHLNLLEYKGITLPSAEIKQALNKTQPVFYSLPLHSKQYFSNLPVVQINLNSNVFYRG